MQAYLNNKSASLYLNNKKIKIINNAGGVYVNELEIPAVTTYYWNPKPFNDEEVVIPIYITDYYQREYYYEDDTLLFDLRVEVDGEVKQVTNLKGGDHNINLTQMFPSKMIDGEHYFSFQVTDKQGRKSYRLFNEIWIVNRNTYPITNAQTYTITDADLTRHNIDKNNSEATQDMINNRVGLTYLFREIRNNGYRKCILPLGTYRINRCKRKKTSNETDVDLPVRVPSGLTIDFNGSTLKLHPYNDAEYGTVGKVENLMLSFENCIDSHVINYIFEGDTAERKSNGWLAPVGGIANGEHNNCFAFYGGKYNSVQNGVMKQITGYSHITGFIDNKVLFFTGWEDNVDIINGIETIKENKCTCDYKDVSTLINNDGFLCLSVWMAMGGRIGNTLWLDVHYYDENKNFLETIRVMQYRRCKIPVMAKFIKVTINGTANQASQLNAHDAPFPTHCSVIDMELTKNRTCMAPSSYNGLLYKNLTFIDGDFTYTPTPAYIDMEDGWERQVDLYLYDCTVITPGGTRDFIDCAGLNHIIDNCNFRSDIRERVHGTTIRNCNGGESRHYIANETGNTRRIYNNTFTNIAGINNWVTPYKIKFVNNTITSFSGYLNTNNFSIQKSNITLIPFTQDVIADTCNVKINAGAYLLRNLYFSNCNFNRLDDQPNIPFYFNELDVYREFIHCTFNFVTRMINGNKFNTGLFENCTFNDDVILSLNNFSNNNKLGDIKFNNCIFDKSITINCLPTQFVEFNNCTFTGNKVLQGSATTNCIFNENDLNKAVSAFRITTNSYNVTLTSTAPTIKHQLNGWITPINAKNKKIYWTSNDDEIATVDSKGLVTCIGGGTAIITGRTEDGDHAATATFTITKNF